MLEPPKHLQPVGPSAEPCPFCGNTYLCLMVETSKCGTHRVTCSGCEAKGSWKMDRDSAIFIWNEVDSPVKRERLRSQIFSFFQKKA